MKINIKKCSNFEISQFDLKNNQGIILDVPDYEYASLDSITKNENAFIVMLDHIEDPHNLGAIIRTGEAAGVDGINGTVMKVSAGALSNIDVSMVTNLANTIRTLKDKGFWIIGTDMNGENYTDIDYNGKICIVIGNEGSGLSKLIEKECDFIASINMKGKINSLNASVATAIVVFEAVKKRNK